MNSCKSIFFITIFCLFSLSLFGKEPDFSLESRIGTLYVDDSGVDGIYNNLQLAFSGSIKNFDINAGFYIGGIPGDISVRNTELRAELKDVLYLGGFFDFEISLSSQFSLEIETLVGLMDSDPGYLGIIPGSVSAPVYGGIQSGLNMPLGFFFNSAVYGADFSVNNDDNESVGNGSAFFTCLNGGKVWKIQKKLSHSISVDAGFMSAVGSGSITASNELDKTILFPYSFMHGAGAGSLSFVTFGGEYIVQGNKFSLITDLYGLINVWSEIEYSYKTTYKKNIIYDGSIVKGNDTVSFSNGDLIIFFNTQLQYDLRTDKINAGFFIRKDFIIPYISEKTLNCFIQKQSSSTSESSSDGADVKGMLKTILLSGISIGAKIEL